MSPQRADLVLTADVPDVELCVLVCDGLDVEADGGDGGDVLVELELVKDCWRTHVSTCVFFVGGTRHILVLPAASSPSMSRRISLDPKILFIILDIWPPIVSAVRIAVVSARGNYEPSSVCVVAGCGGGKAGPASLWQQCRYMDGEGVEDGWVQFYGRRSM